MIFDAMFRECVKCQYLVMIHCVTAAAAHWAPCLGWALMGRDQEQDTDHLPWPRSVDTAGSACCPATIQTMPRLEFLNFDIDTVLNTQYSEKAASVCYKDLQRVVQHALLKLTKIMFPTSTSCHRTLLMCSSDKFTKLSQ